MEGLRARLHLLAGLPAPVQRAGATDAGLRAVARPLWILAACAIVVLLRVGREVLIPLLLAMLLALVLTGIVEGLRRLRIPRGVSAMVLLLLGTAAAGFALDALRAPAQGWIANAPKVLRVIEHRVKPARSAVLRLNDLAARASALTGSPESRPAAHATVASVTPMDVLEQTGSALGSVVTVLVLTLLLLAGGPPVLAHMGSSLAGNVHAAHVLRLVEAIRVEVGRYYGTLALINCGLGLATGLAMWALGMPNPVLWGSLAAVLNFVPYLGAATTLAILTVVALVSFGSIAHVAAVAASFLTLATIEGQLVEPVFLGRRLHLNPIVVFVALWVGGWLWGIAGVVSALPVLVAVKVAAAHSESGSVMARFLGPASDPPAEQPTIALAELPAVLQSRALRRGSQTGADLSG